MRKAVCDAALSAEELDALLEERGGFCSSACLAQHKAFRFMPSPPCSQCIAPSRAPYYLAQFLPDILCMQLSASLVLVRAIWSFSVGLSSSSSSRRKATKGTSKERKGACRGRVGVSEEGEAQEMVLGQEITSHG